MGLASHAESQSVSCLIEPFEVVSLAAQAEGTIVELPVDRGAEVARGDVVVRLDTRIELSDLGKWRPANK